MYAREWRVAMNHSCLMPLWRNTKHGTVHETEDVGTLTSMLPQHMHTSQSTGMILLNRGVVLYWVFNSDTAKLRITVRGRTGGCGILSFQRRFW